MRGFTPAIWMTLLVLHCGPLGAVAQTAFPWSPAQATGEPDTHEAGDMETAWAPNDSSFGPEWLELDFSPAFVAQQVRIHETFNPGAVVELVLKRAGGGELARIPVAPSVGEAPRFLEVPFDPTAEPVASVRIVLDTSRVRGWNEIDAVELVGPERRAWAAAASASSFYGELYPGAPPDADLTTFTGDYTARVTVLRHDGRPAGGAPYRLMYETPYDGPATIAKGRLDTGGRVELSGLMGGARAPTYLLAAGSIELRVGMVALGGDERVQAFTFDLPAEVGDPAPPIDIAHWLKGEKIDAYEPGRIYVLWFWATWCPPCVQAMESLSDLQERFRDEDVAVIGVTDEAPQRVLDYLFEDDGDGTINNDRVDFSLTADPDRSVSRAFMRALMGRSGLLGPEPGIPFAFVIGKDGRIEWIGHPQVEAGWLEHLQQGLTEAVGHIVRDEWDRDAFRLQRVASLETHRLLRDVADARLRHDWRTALELIDDAVALSADHPRSEFQNSGALNDLAWMIVESPRKTSPDLELAMTAALGANRLAGGTNAAILDTVARVHFELGDLEQAIEHQRRAVQLRDTGSFRETLEKYEKAAESGP